MADAQTIGFLGAGKMATALAQGFLRAGLVRADGLRASDVDPAARERFIQATQGAASSNNLDVAAADTLIVAVKPGQVEEVLTGIHGRLTGRTLVISIAAGVTLSSLARWVPDQVRVVRVMPNTPAVIGASASAFAVGDRCTEADANRVSELFSAVGVAVRVKESLLDAVTGLSGSGPAYGFLMVEALADGGVAAGLPRDVALRLAAQTLAGAARMILETGLHPAVLKDQVASPGGTTIDGLHELERAGVRAGLMNAVRAAAEKSRRLGQG